MAAGAGFAAGRCPVLSRGAVEFRKWLGTIARKVAKLDAEGASKSSVGNWQSGLSLPSGPMRERIFELGGPDPDSWDEPHSPTPGALASLGPLAPATAEDTATEADLLLADIRRLRGKVETSDLDVSQQGRLLANLTAMVDKLGHHTGVKHTPRQILDSPHFITIVDRLIEALEPWPEAMRAAADAIDELKAKP